MKAVEVMIKIKGKYNTAKVFTDNLEEAVAQILELCNEELSKTAL